MEVTAELYAWLTGLNLKIKILNNNKSPKNQNNKKVLLDMRTSIKFLNGFFMDKILLELEGLYNIYYNIKLSYSTKLNELIKLQENTLNNETDANLRISIWGIIKDITENFGIELTENSIKKIANGDYNTLNQVLNAVFSLSNELRKKNPDKKGKK
jgi:hypothetical protein